MILEHSSNEDFFMIEHNKYFLIKNIKNYLFFKKTYNRINIEKFNYKFNNLDNVYLILESPSHMAFGHWFFESLIFIPYYQQIKEKYPHIKIHLLEKKNYKLLLLDYFNISENEITYELKDNNLCIIPSPINSVHLLEYLDVFEKNINYLYKSLNLLNYNKSIDILIMPRQKKENFIGNDRNYDKQFENLINKIPNAHILHTDNITKFSEQIEYVRKSKKIYLSDGSAFLVNTFLANNSDIHIIDNVTKQQVNRFKRYKILFDFFKTKNNIYYL